MADSKQETRKSGLGYLFSLRQDSAPQIKRWLLGCAAIGVDCPAIGVDCVAIGVDCAAIGVEALRWALRHSAKKTATSPKDAPIAEMLRQARIHQSAPIAEMLRQALIHQDIPSDDPIELHQAQSPSNGAPPQEE